MEEINAEFEGLSLICVGLQGTLQLQTPPPRSRNDKEIEFSFCLNQASNIKRAVLRGAVTSSVGKGVFHVRTKPAKYFMCVSNQRTKLAKALRCSCQYLMTAHAIDVIGEIGVLC